MSASNASIGRSGAAGSFCPPRIRPATRRGLVSCRIPAGNSPGLVRNDRRHSLRSVGGLPGVCRRGAGSGLWYLRLLAIRDRARPSLLAGTIVAAMASSRCEHYFSYLAMRKLTQERTGAAALRPRMPFPSCNSSSRRATAHSCSSLMIPPTVGTELWGHHLSSRGVWLLWGCDAAITIGVATAFVLVALRRPYCDACGSWFRICRGGQIDTATAEALLSAAALSGRPAGDARIVSGAVVAAADRPALSYHGKHGSKPGVTWLDRKSAPQ